MKRTTGEFLVRQAGGQQYRAYVPAPLPPDPPVRMDAELEGLRDQANRALGRLDGITEVLPDTHLFLYHYVRKEALLSSQIEGTQSSYSDLLLFELEEAPGVPVDDVREVSNYAAALEWGRIRIREGFPLSLRLLREIHGILLRKGRGSDRVSGEFRKGQNRVGGATLATAEFVPPPPDLLNDCLAAFESFLHNREFAVLLRAALAHVQFETIHPFEDGNGRLGRLLITLMLCEENVLAEPTLYLSLYFKSHRQAYYDHLQAVRTDGDWEGWLRFFLEGVKDTSQQAVETARRLLHLFDTDYARVQAIGRASNSAVRVYNLFREMPVQRVTAVAEKLAISHPTATKSLSRLEDLGIVREITGQRRNRLFAYGAYLQILEEGTEPL